MFPCHNADSSDGDMNQCGQYKGDSFMLSVKYVGDIVGMNIDVNLGHTVLYTR